MLDHIKKGPPKIEGVLQTENPVMVKDLSNVKMMASGSDHFIALTNDGKVFAMGDDTFG